ncbi:hypothetical protein QFZ66_001014 [Streptomyces sp. B4I13]|nr:hypothetical protein [Streptomyces sp. B4I13]
MTSAISRFSASTSLSAAIRVSCVSRSRAMTSRRRSFSMRSFSMAMTRSRVLRGDSHLAGLILPLDAELLLGPEEGALRAQPLLLHHPRRLGLLAGPYGVDLPLLLDLGVGLPALQLQDGLAGIHVLPGDLLLLRALGLVGAHVLHGRQLGDLADALRVEDVGRVELGQRRLLQVVDRRVLQVVAVEVDADDLDDPVPQLLALGVQVGEVQLLADRLQRLGELRMEQLLQRVPVTRPRGADGLGDLDDVLDGLVDLHEERDPDVRADVVLTDETVLAGARDLDRLHRDVHHLGLVQHRQDDLPGEGHVDLAQLGDDQRLALLHLAKELGDDEYDNEADGDEHADAHEHGNHGIRPSGVRELSVKKTGPETSSGGGAAQAARPREGSAAPRDPPP